MDNKNKTDTRPKIKLNISAEIINGCIDTAKKVVNSKMRFEELGGVLLGYFDGINIYATKFLYDNMAVTSPGSIHFSENIFKEARTFLRKNGCQRKKI